MNRIIRFFKQFFLWVKYSRYLGCKHCCINCQFYNFCQFELDNEIEDIEDHLDFRTKF